MNESHSTKPQLVEAAARNNLPKDLDKGVWRDGAGSLCGLSPCITSTIGHKIKISVTVSNVFLHQYLATKLHVDSHFKEIWGVLSILEKKKNFSLGHHWVQTIPACEKCNSLSLGWKIRWRLIRFSWLTANKILKAEVDFKNCKIIYFMAE